MKTTRKTNNTPARNLELPASAPLAVKELNSHLGRLREAHERMSAFLGSFNDALAAGDTEKAGDFWLALKQETTFIHQVGAALESKVMEGLPVLVNTLNS